MSHQWFYIQAGMISDEQIGPIEESRLLELLQSGDVKPTTKVLSQTRTKGSWYKIDQIPSFVKLYNEHLSQRLEQKRQEKSAQQESSRRQREAALQVAQERNAQDSRQQQQLTKITDTDASTFERMKQAVVPLLTREEKILYVAVQRNFMGVNIKQDAAIATNKRLILYRAKILGRYDFDDYLWRDL